LLLMFGEKSDFIGIRIADKIAAQLLNGTVVKVQSASHFLPMEQPEEVVRMAVELFSRK
jgi:pimeloyl-ACP methyl ester carboxylesterase